VRSARLLSLGLNLDEFVFPLQPPPHAARPFGSLLCIAAGHVSLNYKMLMLI
jgi:hypothetical protein